METPKKSAHQIWREAKEQNLTKEQTKELLVSEGIIVKKTDHNTLYRKVAVSERLPKEDNWYHTNRGGCDFNPNSKEFEDVNGDAVQIQYWLEEIPDNSHQIEKLQADKAELLEILEDILDGKKMVERTFLWTKSNP